MNREERVAGLVKAGELLVQGGDEAQVAELFNTREYRFHGPGGFETDYSGLAAYFASYRAAFDDRSIRRGIMVAEGEYIACQTWIQGLFAREFAQSPAGPLPPNGRRIVSELQNIFRFDGEGRLVEEWIQTDNRTMLDQLQAGRGD